ncbi:MAG: cupin domain-containing protein [Actinobacteria bacterium]|nr:cupin domain-containing protein [Actinomycetota bacterium]
MTPPTRTGRTPPGPTSTAPTPDPATGLARCVGDADGFLDRYWTQAPLHRVGADPSGFADLFSLDDVDRFVASSSPRLPSFRLVRDGRPLDPARYTRTARVGGQPVSGIGDPGRIFDEFRAGATIVFQGLQRSHAAITRFCRALELELSHAVQANAYVTPAGAQGLGVHYDTHDVFVLQLAGTKAWSIYEPVLTDPLVTQPWKGTADDAGEPCLSVELAAGDCLYVPRGFLHSATAQRELSAHLTVGVVSTTWHDVVRDLVAGTAEEPEFRRALPAGYADHPERLAAEVEEAVARLRKWLDGVDASVVAATTARRFLATRPPLLAGQLRQLEMAERLDDGSVLRRREGSVCLLEVAGDTLTVALGGKELRMPAALRPALARIAGDGPFRLGDLGDLMDGPSRIVLGRRLVVEGLLEIVDLG